MTNPSRNMLLSRLAVIGLCIVGAWLSGELLKRHYGSVWHDAAPVGVLDRICQAGDAWGLSCQKSTGGAWSEILLPGISFDATGGLDARWVAVPVAFVGLAYFVFIGVWTAFVTGPGRGRDALHTVSPVIVLAGGLGTLAMIAMMAVGVVSWCLPCMLVHGVNLAMVGIVAGVALPRPSATADERGVFSRTSPGRRGYDVVRPREAARGLAFAAILIGGLWIYRGEHVAFQRQYRNLWRYKAFVADLQSDPAFLLREFRAQPRVTGLQDHASQPGRITLTVFTDFACGACYCNWREIERIRDEVFDGQLDVRLRHYPLCQACNEHVAHNAHPQACGAACAVEAARLQGGNNAAAWMHDALFANRRRLGPSLYRELATAIGLEVDRFVQDLSSPAVRQRVETDIALAHTLGVEATPTMFVDGRRITPLLRTSAFWQALADTLDHNGNAVATDTERLDKRVGQ